MKDSIGLVLTGVMILVFLGSVRATVAVFLSIPLSALAAFIALSIGNSTVNAMILGGLALAFSRLIDNSVVVLENIFRHMEMGEPPEVAAERAQNRSQASHPDVSLGTPRSLFHHRHGRVVRHTVSATRARRFRPATGGLMVELHKDLAHRAEGPGSADSSSLADDDLQVRGA